MTKHVQGEAHFGEHELNGGYFTGVFVELPAGDKEAVEAMTAVGDVRIVPADAFDAHAHLARQAAWSAATFGPGDRTAGIVAHARKELAEVLEAREDVDRRSADPRDVLAEWIDVIILGFDGALRTGATPAEVIAAWVAKQARNEARKWPDWRTMPADVPIEHDRSGDGAFIAGQRVKVTRKVYNDGAEWVPEMDKTLGKSGTIIEVDEDGDVAVDIDGLNDYWFYDRAALSLI